MAVELSWYVPNEVLYIRYGENVIKDDLLESYQSIATYAKEAGKPIHVIMDSLLVQRMDFSLKELKELLKDFNPANIGWGINITSADPMSSRASSFMLAILNQSLNIRSRTYKSLAESHDFLIELDQALESKLPG